MSFTPRVICAEGNFPKRKVLAEEYLQLIVDLHNKRTGRVGRMSEDLLVEGLLNRAADGSLHNNAMVIQISEGQELIALASQYAHVIEKIVRDHLSAIQVETRAIGESLGQPFSEHSFFILSNVLLDNWQIRNVEDLYLRTDRPLRGDKKFYFAIMERSQNEKDPFGIYGNVARIVEKDSCCFYGNNQGTLSALDFADLRRKSHILMLSQNANQGLSKVALIVRDDLILFFQSIDQNLRSYHANSRWAYLTYAEFFIWWYHFLYTQVTNDLAKGGHLIIPEGGMYPYIIKGEQ